MEIGWRSYDGLSWEFGKVCGWRISRKIKQHRGSCTRPSSHLNSYIHAYGVCTRLSNAIINCIGADMVIDHRTQYKVSFLLFSYCSLLSPCCSTSLVCIQSTLILLLSLSSWTWGSGRPGPGVLSNNLNASLTALVSTANVLFLVPFPCVLPPNACSACKISTCFPSRLSLATCIALSDTEDTAGKGVDDADRESGQGESSTRGPRQFVRLATTSASSDNDANREFGCAYIHVSSNSHINHPASGLYRPNLNRGRTRYPPLTSSKLDHTSWWRRPGQLGQKSKVDLRYLKKWTRGMTTI